MIAYLSWSITISIHLLAAYLQHTCPYLISNCAHQRASDFLFVNRCVCDVPVKFHVKIFVRLGDAFYFASCYKFVARFSRWSYLLCTELAKYLFAQPIFCFCGLLSMVQKAFDECSNIEKYNIYKVYCELQSQVLGGHQNVDHHEKRETHL